MPETSPKDTELYAALQKKCRHAGTNIRQLCITAGVSYKTVSGWKHTTPKSIQLLQDLEGALTKIAAENE